VIVDPEDEVLEFGVLDASGQCSVRIRVAAGWELL
jgi:hypothetical protein